MAVYNDYTRQLSISGVQVKYSVQLVNGELQLTEKNGQYIIKPVPTGTFHHLDQAPVNEHLTMQIAKIFRINVPPNVLIYFDDGSPAYLVKRFDRQPDGSKRQQEDFAQIAAITPETHGKNYKYDLSYQEIGALISQHIPTYRIELEKYFRLIIFNYVIGNGDAHVKNFSVIQSPQGDYVLTPAYDLLCTKLHAPNETDMALMLFNDRFSDTYNAYGFYTLADFQEFAQILGVSPTRGAKILAPFQEINSTVLELIERSFLSDDARQFYSQTYKDRVSRLNMGG